MLHSANAMEVGTAWVPRPDSKKQAHLDIDDRHPPIDRTVIAPGFSDRFGDFLQGPKEAVCNGFIILSHVSLWAVALFLQVNLCYTFIDKQKETEDTASRLLFTAFLTTALTIVLVLVHGSFVHPDARYRPYFDVLLFAGSMLSAALAWTVYIVLAMREARTIVDVPNACTFSNVTVTANGTATVPSSATRICDPKVTITVGTPFLFYDSAGAISDVVDVEWHNVVEALAAAMLLTITLACILAFHAHMMAAVGHRNLNLVGSFSPYNIRILTAEAVTNNDMLKAMVQAYIRSEPSPNDIKNMTVNRAWGWILENRANGALTAFAGWAKTWARQPGRSKQEVEGAEAIAAAASVGGGGSTKGYYA